MNATSTPTPRKPRRRLANPFAVGVLVLAIAGAGWWAWDRYGASKNPREQYQIATVQKGDIEDLVTATGTVQPRDYVDVGAQVSGQLKKLHVEVGSRVESGDLLAEIDPTVFKATVEARRAGLRNQQASLTERESALAMAQIQATRQRNLLAADATTKEAVQLAETSLRAATAQIAAIKAQIEQTQSTLKADEATLNYARIYAPMAGTVVSLTARQGQTLNANQSAPTVLRIADLTTMTVQTQVSEAEVSKLRQGMEVYFTTIGGQGRRWYGALRKVEPTPTVTNNVVLYNALFDVPNTNQALMPSMTTQVFFIAASAQGVLVVPTGAVTMARQGGNARGSRRDRAASDASPSASAPSGAASATATLAASAAPRASAPRQRDAGDTPRATPTAAPRAASGPAAGGAGGGDMSRFASMTPEERRAAFEAMTPEQREAMRERRRAMREQQGGEGEPRAPRADGEPRGPRADGEARAPRADGAPRAERADGEPRATRTDGAASAPRTPRRAAGAASAASAGMPDNAASAPVRRGTSGGFAGSSGPRAPRQGTVKVIDAKGVIEERKVELGVVTRVSAQVLSGLKEGDEVVVGIKPPPAAQRNASQTQGGGLQPGGNVPGAGPGAGGQGGGNRGR